MTFRYPKGPDDPDVDEYTRGQFSSVFKAAGSNDPDTLVKQSGAGKAPAPWPRAAQDKRRAPFDKGVVGEGIRNPNFRDLDPAQLHSTQSEITRQGVDYYMGERYEQTGETFADQGQAGNRFPVVYNREGTNMILSGHHRAAASLLRGEQFRANYMEGGWGE